MDVVLKNSSTVPSVFLIYGHCPQDVAAGDSLVEVLKEKAPILIVRRHCSDQHAIAKLVLSKEFIATSIDCLKKQQPFADETKQLAFDSENIDNGID